MLGAIRVAARDRARLGEVVATTSRFGLDVLLARLGLDAARRDPDAIPFDLPARTRQAMEALGPVWVKLGQILATRADLLPPEWIAELERLHSAAPRLPFDQLRQQVEATLGESPETAFARFDAEPLAAASMAQVHRAALADGTEVVLKIRRPGIRAVMEADLRLLTQLASMVEVTNAEARRYGAVRMIRELGRDILEELDFTNEGRNADRLREDFADDPRVVVPVIHWAYSSETLLVMDFVAGVPPRDAAKLREAGIDPAAIASAGADIVLDMTLINGRFHGDPHPGNLLCLPGNRIAMLDLGLIGHVSPRRREEVIAFTQSIANSDPSLLAETLKNWSQTDDIAPERFQAVADRLVARHGGGPIRMAAMLGDIFPILREERIVLQPEMLLLFKALITIDGVLSGIQPDFDLSTALRRASARIVEARLSPERWTRRAAALALELDRLGDDLPRLIRATTRKLESDNPTASTMGIEAAIRAGAGWIAGALAFTGLVIAASMHFG
ncbi:ABC1 kinase family protein [Sphingomonas sanguinis]|uniref:AarF/ABC1/UbiB kinase family protein n=1 Tax=Sphingomonas sanguinis TaxID=33051 RepID=A0A7Y7QXI2_9SPHN|nr:AarF/UbiB family protein [Sphingomonas sanguinis]MBZ6382894.1 AarF/ABC1/UbiB kinase family protein [Sphingomonas sanguinis]NNG51523.1 AarF/ABC1/UbiB kinase family protein [Sphingomonas sanguinis]NNG52448.1 AarF/ABC1/UbiB kinase family protein [Sphingomonas sanguinis]NVP32194.1 AarF/ABC1/UbiB kinase family protein [Sphingomonas sanguinis]